MKNKTVSNTLQIKMTYNKSVVILHFTPKLQYSVKKE